MPQMSLEEALVEVWRQALVENAKVVELGAESYSVRRTPKKGLRQVDFVFDGEEIRGLEQNPDTKSHRAQLARSGKMVMQFVNEGGYVANVVDGKDRLINPSRIVSHSLGCNTNQPSSGGKSTIDIFLD